MQKAFLPMTASRGFIEHHSSSLEVKKLPAREGKVTLDTNKLSMPFILSMLLNCTKDQFFYVTQSEDMKIFKRGAQLYVVPLRGKEPPKGFNWKPIGRAHGRNAYVIA